MSIRKLIKKRTVTIDEDNAKQHFILEYYVLEKELFMDDTCTNTFGIEVLKRSNPTNGILKIEYRKIFDIFCCESDAIDAALFLAQNTVTPISVHDVIEQFIGTNEFECEEYEIAAV